MKAAEGMSGLAKIIFPAINPWNNSNIGEIILDFLMFTFIIILIASLVLSKNKTLRYLKFVQVFPYFLIANANLLIITQFRWFVAVPFMLFTSIVAGYMAMKKEFEKAELQEAQGGWCYNVKHRNKLMSDFENMSEDEKKSVSKKFEGKPLYIHPILFFVVTIGLPILVVCILNLSGVRYYF